MYKIRGSTLLRNHRTGALSRILINSDDGLQSGLWNV